jgi:hypothetical protein
MVAKILVVNAEDADAVSALVFDQQRQGVEQPKHQVQMTQSQLYVTQLHEQLHQIVVVKNTELPVQHYTLQLVIPAISPAFLRGRIFRDHIILT